MAVESLRALRRRVRSIDNIRQITRAMGMVAAAKLRRAQANLAAARPYARRLERLMLQMAESGALDSHPLFVPRDGARSLLVLFTADRGLCGSFLTNLLNVAEYLLQSEPDTQWRVLCVGNKGRQFFEGRPWPIHDSMTDVCGEADHAWAGALADRLRADYLADAFDSILLLHPSFTSAALSRPTVTHYLNLNTGPFGLKSVDPDREETTHDWLTPESSPRPVDYLMEPSREAALEALIPHYLRSKIYITMAETAASEHGARMVAMNNAASNCRDLGDRLTLQLNKARQSSITKELLDIVGGAEALR